MRFLIDENLPYSLVGIFQGKGFEAESVLSLDELRGHPDEDIFNYAVKNSLVIITRDLRFTNPNQFDLSKIVGISIIRFPNEISISKLRDELSKLISSLKENDFKQILVFEPGSIRARPLPNS